MLQGHPDDEAAAPASTSPPALSARAWPAAVGMAMAGKMDHKDYQVFVASWATAKRNEGEIWEACQHGTTSTAWTT